MCWRVERWGGNANHKRRTVFLGSEDLATQKFEVLYRELRQGVVELIAPDGRLARRYGSGRCRSSGNIFDLADAR